MKGRKPWPLRSGPGIPLDVQLAQAWVRGSLAVLAAFVLEIEGYGLLCWFLLVSPKSRVQ